MAIVPRARRNPFRRRALWGGAVCLAGLAMALQPYLLALRAAGVVMALCSLPVFITSRARTKELERMLKLPLFEAQEGVLYEGGALHGGRLHFLGTMGCAVESCAVEEDRLILRYSFPARKVRGKEELLFTISPGNEEQARRAVAHYARGESI